MRTAKLIAKCFALAMLAAATIHAEEDPAVVRKPLSLASIMDFGQIVSGQGDSAQAGDLTGQFLQRTSVWLTQETIVGDRFDIKIGAGGIFWYGLPEAKAGGEGAHKLLTKFGPGISQAQATYKFGDPAKPMFSLQMGLFPYKYNPDAQNLGEYLLRSGTYPGTLRGSSWNMVSSASFLAQGLRLGVTLWGGRFRMDYLLPMERDLPPMYDISPTLVTSLTPLKGLEFGGGITWNHGIPIRPSLTSPKDTGFYLLKNPGNAYFKRIPNPDKTLYGPFDNIYVRDTSGYYTFQGLKLMARASVDPKAFLDMSMLGPQDLKLYAEVALLGVKDYPVLYEKRLQRMPVMVGFNLPTFRLLDLLSLEIEYYGSRFPNNFYQVYNNRLPIPEWASKWAAIDTITNYNPDDPKYRKDDWKWSIMAKKNVMRGVRVYAQAACDNMRPFDYEVQPFWVPATTHLWKDWYYLFRLELAI
jgi:hypothetical protein